DVAQRLAMARGQQEEAWIRRQLEGARVEAVKAFVHGRRRRANDGPAAAPARAGRPRPPETGLEPRGGPARNGGSRHKTPRRVTSGVKGAPKDFPPGRGVRHRGCTALRFRMPTGLEVAVTGTGLAVPIGLGAEQAWRRSVCGESGIGALRRFDTSGYACAAGAEVPPFALDGLRLAKNEKFMNTAVRCAMRAAREAVASSGADLARFDPYRVALYAGS